MGSKYIKSEIKSELVWGLYLQTGSFSVMYADKQAVVSQTDVMREVNE